MIHVLTVAMKFCQNVRAFRLSFPYHKEALAKFKSLLTLSQIETMSEYLLKTVIR